MRHIFRLFRRLSLLKVATCVNQRRVKVLKVEILGCDNRILLESGGVPNVCSKSYTSVFRRGIVPMLLLFAWMVFLMRQLRLEVDQRSILSLWNLKLTSSSVNPGIIAKRGLISEVRLCFSFLYIGAKIIVDRHLFSCSLQDVLLFPLLLCDDSLQAWEKRVRALIKLKGL